MTLNEYCTGIADAIRTKEGSTEKIPAPDHATRILAIQTGVDTSDANATAADIAEDSTAYVNGEKVTGAVPVVASGYGTVVTGTWDATIKKAQGLFDKDTLMREGSGVIVDCPDASSETQTYELCTVNVSGCASNGSVAFIKYRTDIQAPVTWLQSVSSVGTATLTNVVKGSYIKVYAGAATFSTSSSSGIERITDTSLYTDVLGSGYGYKVLETAGDTETITISLD